MKKYKKKLDYSFCIGVYPTLELLNSRPDEVIRILIDPKGERNEGVVKIRQLAKQYSIPVEVATTAIFKIAQSENVYAVGVFNKYTSELAPGNHLVLVNPSDKGNLGTIIRTALAFDIKNIAIVAPAPEIFDPKVVRASMGAVFRINYAYFDSWGEYQGSFKNNFYPFMTNGKNVLGKVSFRKPFSLVFGNEGSGLSASFNNIGESVVIPQGSSVDSLNLSSAVAIGLYSAFSKA